MSKTYDDDFYTWAMTQADAARRRSTNEIDWDQVAEELENLGRAEQRELKSRYVVLLTHLLKWMYQASLRSKSWTYTIANQREELADHLQHNPGLAPKEEDAFLDAYRLARRAAAVETELDLDTFPIEPPFTMQQAKDEAWLPD